MRRRIVYFGFFLLLGLLAHLAVAVVCAFAVDVQQEEEQVGFRRGNTRSLHINVQRSPGAVRIMTGAITIQSVTDLMYSALALESLNLPWWSRSQEEVDSIDSGINDYEVEDARGWPLHSLRCALLPARIIIIRDQSEEFELVEHRSDTIVVRNRERTSTPLNSRAHPNVAIPIPVPPSGLVKGGLLLPMTGTDPNGDPTIFVLPLTPIWPEFIANTLFYTIILWLVIGLPRAIRRRRRIKRSQCPSCGYRRGTSHLCTECGAEPAPEERRTVAAGEAARSAKPTAAQPVDDAAE